MERGRSMSSSSTDSWSLLDEPAEMSGRNEAENVNTSPATEPESPTIEMDSLEAISTVSLPLDLPSALLGSPSRAQHLLVVTTPASCSIVTQGGAILSPAQTAQALTECGNSSDPDSPVLVNPPKSPPIESSFTFLKDPKLRISFSDSCESKEDEEQQVVPMETKPDCNEQASENCENDEVFETASDVNEENFSIKNEAIETIENPAEEAKEDSIQSESELTSLPSMASTLDDLVVEEIKEEEEVHENLISRVDTVQLVSRTLDELSEHIDESSYWQKFLDSTFSSFKSFERSDTIINIIIMAMFLTSISSMTILHILENSWMGSANMSHQHHPKQLLNAHFQTDKSASPQLSEEYPPYMFKLSEYNDRNTELQHCQDELLEAKHAYESKAKLLHYVRFKELEQETLVNELRLQLEQAQKALDDFRKENPQENAFSPILASNFDAELEKMVEFGNQKRRMIKRRKLLNAMERGQHEEKMEKCAVKEEMMPQNLAALIPPSHWPSQAKPTNQLIAPPATLDCQLTPPPVRKPVYSTKKQTVSSEKNDNDDHEFENPKQPESEKSHNEEENYFGQNFYNGWQKRHELLQNLSTHTGRSAMLRSVKRAVIAQLNKTIGKTTTALMKATKFVTTENFGKNLFKEVMAHMENSANSFSKILDCFNKGLQQLQNFQFCGNFQWNNEEGDDEEVAIKKKQKSTISKYSDEWWRAKRRFYEGRSRLSNCMTIIPANRSDFTHWLFARAALRQKQRKEQQNGTVENETRSSLLNNDWMYARQKVRAKLRQAEFDKENGNNDWFFARHKRREKARRNGSIRRKQNPEEHEDWLFARQKLRQKFREHKWHRNDDHWEHEHEYAVNKKWKRKAQRKKWKFSGASGWDDDD